MRIVRDTLAIVRDALLIVVLLAAIILAVKFATAVRDAGERLSPSPGASVNCGPGASTLVCPDSD